MKTPSQNRCLIEPLEARIAPALLVNGANLLGGSGNPSTGETSVGGNSVTLVQVLSGQAIVWFDQGSILSISFGPNTSLSIHGDVNGDIVGNLTANGRLSDSDNNPANGEDGAVLMPNNLVGLVTSPLSTEAGSLGNVITGGSVSGLNISGQISGIYAGDGVFRPESHLLSGVDVVSSVGSLDVNPVQSGTQSTFDFTQAIGKFQAGASIKNAQISQAAALQAFAGSGNPSGAVLATAGPAGGSIAGITIGSAFVPAGAAVDTPSYSLIAGDGADGKSGGAGGYIDHISETTSFGPVVIHAGKGGDGAAGGGGGGGSITNLDLQSNSARYSVVAGDGGNGAPAGDGGRVVNNSFANRTPTSGIVVSADFTGDGRDDILVIDAGTGQMVLSTQDDPNIYDGINQSGGSQFQQVVQYVNKVGQDVVLIDPAGLTPDAALAADVDGDGKLDIIVAYKNSNSLAVFFNQGHGVFWDPNLGTAGAFSDTSFALGYSPAKIAIDSTNVSVIAVAENTNGQGILHYAVPQRGATSADVVLNLSQGLNTFTQPVADLAFQGGTFLAGFTNGTISELSPAGLQSKVAFTVKDTGIAITGGITGLDVDSTGLRLLALSAAAHTVSVFDATTGSYVPVDTIALPANSVPLVAHFEHTTSASTVDEIATLESLAAGSELDLFVQPPAGAGGPSKFANAGSLKSQLPLKNFAAAYDNGNLQGDAALSGSLSQFTFTPDLSSTQQYALPFASKKVNVQAGAGGDGLDLGKLLGKGGAGGGINGINADANEITITAGLGGDSQSGPAGAGGSVSNPATFMTASGATVTPTLLADVLLSVAAGDGGTPTGTVVKTAAGGAGGALNGLSLTLGSGDMTLTTGNGGDGNGGAGGAGGNFTNMQTLLNDGSIAVITGNGGNAQAGAGAGGAGGSVVTFSHQLALDSDVEAKEKSYSVTIMTGHGGASAGGAGGVGGGIAGTSLKLDGANRTYDDGSVTPPLVDAHADSTVRVNITSGQGGSGLTGGNGGTISGLTSNSVFDQVTPNGNVLLNYVTMHLTSGAGGNGSAGNGGNGGGMLFGQAISGITFYDPDSTEAAAGTTPFTATTGHGGNGSAKGGAGGTIDNLTLQNSPFADGNPIKTTHLQAADIHAGSGGNGGTSDGGAGGSVTRATIGVQGGSLNVQAGDGGNGGAAGKGGAGGSVATSTLGLVSTYSPLGLLAAAGKGGNGTTGGGAGGALSSLQISTPQSTNGISAILTAGAGGNANAAKAVGGKGGDVSGIVQAKDLNSSINTIAAGSGGNNPLGVAGAGGNIMNLRTVGFIGRPSDGANKLGVFDQINFGGGNTATIAQGLFSGIGGTGATAGVNGSVSNVTARQIAAISAFNLSTQAFAAAPKVMNVKADLIGFDANSNATFDSTVPATPSPSKSTPIDGFILATVLQQVTGLPKPSFIFTA